MVVYRAKNVYMEWTTGGPVIIIIMKLNFSSVALFLETIIEKVPFNFKIEVPNLNLDGHSLMDCDRVLIVPSRWRHCYNYDTVFFNYFTFIYSFVRLGHELYYIMLLLVSYCIFPVQ